MHSDISLFDKTSGTYAITLGTIREKQDWASEVGGFQYFPHGQVSNFRNGVRFQNDYTRPDDKFQFSFTQFRAKFKFVSHKAAMCPRQHHTIRNCPKFLNMMVGERENFIRRHGLCLNCFSKSHRVQHCNSSHNCYTCDRRHNTLLHYNPGPNNSANQFGSNFRRNYQDIRQRVASNSMQYSSNSNSAGTQLENRSGENFYSIRQETNSSPVRSNPNSTANNSHSGQQKNFSVQIQNEDQQPTPHIVKANFGSISVSEEKAL